MHYVVKLYRIIRTGNAKSSKIKPHFHRLFAGPEHQGLWGNANGKTDCKDSQNEVAQATKEALSKGVIPPLGFLAFEVRFESGLEPRVLRWH